MRLLLALLAAALIGCPGSDDDDDSTPVIDPELVLVIPADGTSGVPITQDVTAEWTAPVDGVVFAVMTDGVQVPGMRQSVQDGRVWAWQPDGDFLPLTTYNVVLTWVGGAESETFGFTTGELTGDDDDSASDDDDSAGDDDDSANR